MMNSSKAEIFEQLIALYYSPHQVSTLGITGRAGAGKTKFTVAFADYCEEKGIETVQYMGDWNFKLSSAERKEWLEDPRQTGDLGEYVRRANQESWWDFKEMEENLHLLRSGVEVPLVDVYDKQTGEKTLNTLVEPPSNGLILLENAFIGDVIAQLDGVVFLHAQPAVAFARTLERDGHRKSFYDLLQRVAETTMSEDSHWQKFMPAMLGMGEKFVAIDNTNYLNPRLLTKDDRDILAITQPFDGLLIPISHLKTAEYAISEK